MVKLGVKRVEVGDFVRGDLITNWKRVEGVGLVKIVMENVLRGNFFEGESQNFIFLKFV